MKETPLVVFKHKNYTNAFIIRTEGDKFGFLCYDGRKSSISLDSAGMDNLIANWYVKSTEEEAREVYGNLFPELFSKIKK